MNMKLLSLLSIIFLFTGIAQAQWISDVRLTNDAGSSQASGNNAWAIAADGDNLHVVWYDNRDGNDEIYYKRSADGGVSWGSDTRLTINNAASQIPSVAVTGSIVHITWADLRDGNNEIYYKRSTDGGTTWGSDIRLTTDAAISILPSLAVSGAAVHVVWRDSRDGNQEIYYKGSSDGGTTWGADTRLTNSIGTSTSPSVAADGQYVYAAWQDNRDGNAEIYFKSSSNSGTSWGTDTRLTNDIANSNAAAVAAAGSDIHVVWNENRDGNTEIYYKHSATGGQTWGTDTRLTNDPAISSGASIAASGQIVHTTWRDDRNGNPEIYYKRSANYGGSWSADLRLTNDANISFTPSVAASGSAVHVVWRDTRDGNNEIYYKSDSTGNSLPSVNAGNNVTIYLGYGLQQATLTATATGGRPPYSYLWSNTDITQSTIVSPVITTSYTVTVTDDLGITATDQVTVTVIDVRCGNGNKKVLVCHNGQSNCISPNAVPAHLAHGDILGSCVNSNKIANEEKETAGQNQLFQNYPNPFRSVTNIRFEVSNETFVTLKLYDLTGREVETMVNEVTKPGVYEVQWDASGFAAGSYYYVLNTSHSKEIRKMILLK
jgi:hypothetical protein